MNQLITIRPRRATWGVVWLLIILAAGLAGCSSVIPPASGALPTIPRTEAAPDLLDTPTPQAVLRLAQFEMLPRTYLVNPGIGWQTDSATDTSIILPEAVAYAVRRDISWDILNPAQGIYEWTPLDAALQQAISEGKQFSFRVYTMVGGGMGGEKIPNWVLAEGAALLPTGEPDYSNCIYQERWGDFVEAMVQRYDANPNIAFIDISGYGDFNEWSWQDQTTWDDAWQNALNAGSPDAAALESLDGQARRRLADIFIGGSFRQHACRDRRGQVEQVDYAYRGFRKTQLVMPFAGIRQSMQYVRWRRTDVGFRYDCLGRSVDDRLVTESAANIWRTAPVVFELCSPDQFGMASAQEVLQATHGSLIHGNGYSQDPEALQQLLLPAGYRYTLKSLQTSTAVRAGTDLSVVMLWQNAGLAPSYPKLGDEFKLHLLVTDASGQQIVIDNVLPVNIASWMPADAAEASPPNYGVPCVLHIPQDARAGPYDLKVEILNERTGEPIQLDLATPSENGRYVVGQITITP